MKKMMKVKKMVMVEVVDKVGYNNHHHRDIVDAKDDEGQTILTSAFKNPDASLAIQIINNGSMTQCVAIRGIDTRGTMVRRHLTNEDYDLVKMNFEGRGCAGPDRIGAVIEGKSMVTFVVQRY